MIAHDLGELAVEGAVGDAEAAVPDHRVEPVVAEPRAGRQGLNVVEDMATRNLASRCAFPTAHKRPRALLMPAFAEAAD